MSHRIDIYKNATEPYNGLLAINAHLKKSVLPADLVELVFLRVSLINGCAYCIDKHSRDLLKSGMSIDKLVLVPVGTRLANCSRRARRRHWPGPKW
jgi:AhpD family alkylhydroperoxidase